MHIRYLSSPADWLVCPFRGCLVALFVILAPVAAFAETGNQDCALAKIAELPMLADEYGSPIVSTMLDNQPRRMLIDTGGFWSLIDPAIGPQYNPKSLGVTGMLGLEGIRITKVARIPSLQLGVVKFSYGEFFLSPPHYNDNFEGTLGANWLKTMDVEIDPVTKKVSLFSQQHCEGNVIYWPHQDEAVVPLDIDRMQGTISISIKLNGKEIRAVIDTGSPETFLSTRTAERVFDLTRESPGAEAMSLDDEDVDKSKKSFRYKFDSLDLDGIDFKNPWLMVTPMVRQGPDMIIGMHHLAGLHMYFAYDEKKLYVTTAHGDIAARRAAGDASIAATDIEDPLARTNARDYVQTGETALDKRDFDRAGAAVARAIEVDPQYVPAYLLRAHLHWEKGEHEQATADIARAIRLDPQNPQVYELRMSLLQRSGDYVSAFADADQLVKFSPRSAVALNNRCWLGAILGHLDAALPDCNAALEIDPKSAATRDSRAFVQFKAGRLDLALTDYTAAIDLDPKQASSLYGRGLIKKQKGDLAGAQADIDAATRIDKDIAQHFGK